MLVEVGEKHVRVRLDRGMLVGELVQRVLEMREAHAQYGPMGYKPVGL